MRFRELRHPLVLTGALLYALLTYGRQGAHGPLPALVTGYLADLLFLPLALTLALATLRHLYFRRAAFVLPPTWILSAWLVTTVWFELLLPRWRASATADPLDALAYALGGLLFARWLNRSRP